LLEVWQFQVEVIDDNIKHTFTAQTDKTWGEFSEEVYRYLASHSGVDLRFRFGRETCPMSYLRSEEDWAKAVALLQEKIKSARQLAVSMQIKNLVSHAVKIEGT
jgi:hypothetical protein